MIFLHMNLHQEIGHHQEEIGRHHEGKGIGQDLSPLKGGGHRQEERGQDLSLLKGDDHQEEIGHHQ